LTHYARRHDPAGRSESRLAFRELGLAIGLAAVERMRSGDVGLEGAEQALDALSEHRALGEAIVRFWWVDAHRRARTWIDHRDINEVMLATALLPDGLLELPAVD